MPTPNRGYVYPSTSSPATVPDDLRTPLEQVDADVQTLVDELESAVRVNPDGTLPAEVEARVERIAADHGTPPGAVPVFQTRGEAQAWEASHPGQVALTIEPPADPGAWPAARPAFDLETRTYTIPSDPGAIYRVDGVVVEDGPHPVGIEAVTVVVTATARPGYTLIAPTSWEFSWPAWTPSPGTVLVSDGFTGDGPLVGRVADAALGGAATTWQDVSGNGNVTVGGVLASGTGGAASALLPVATQDYEVAFRLVTPPSGAGTSISLRDGSVGRYVLNWGTDQSLRVQRFGPSGGTIVSGMQATIGPATVGTVIRFRVVGPELTLIVVGNSGNEATLTGTDSDVPTGDGVSVALTAGIEIDDLVVTAL